MFVYPLTRSAHAAAHRAVAAQQFGRAVERLFDETTDRYFGGAKPGSAARTPALDVAENDTSFTVDLDVPGVTRDQLKVTIEGRRVSVETATPVDEASANNGADATAPKGGERAQKPANGASRVLYRERGPARYERTVVLPAEVDQAASQAKVENGVLTLTLAKKVPTGALQISVS
ncbi:MAG: Hsp20/alpha crystallin family protein [Caldimonas sp.]